MRRSDPALSASAFTLVELILVMALLATLMAIAAPSLSRSLRGHNLDEEAKRLIALTEYARSEAISQGVPMVVWIDAEAGEFGVEPKPGYPAGSGRTKSCTLQPDVHFDFGNRTTGQGVVAAVELSPDGTPDPSSLASVRLVDRTDASIAVTKTPDGWGYEIVRSGQ